MRWARAILSVGAWGCASHALAAPPVRFVPAAELLAAIRSAPEQHGHIALIDYLKARDYSAAVARRTSPGAAEVHRRMTDVWYVVAGSGTLVTGGVLVASRQTAPDELRGSAVAGGVSRHIAGGDLVTIPAGTPHWVSAIDGKELIYLVVKVAAAQGTK